MPLGAGGDSCGPHAKDQSAGWADGVLTVPMLWKEAVDEGAALQLVVRPRGAAKL